MPQLSDILEKREKQKFKKRNYRPWDLQGGKEELVVESEEKDSLESGQANTTQEVIEQSFTKSDNKDNNKGDDKDNGNRFSQKVSMRQAGKASITAETEAEVINSQTPSNQTMATIKEIRLNDFVAEGITVEHLIKTLSGHQDRILKYIAGKCIANKRYTTEPIVREQIIYDLHTTYGIIKTSLRRLEEKGLIKAISKRGRGGYFRFSILPDALAILKTLI